jgi:hypothetical protein
MFIRLSARDRLPRPKHLNRFTLYSIWKALSSSFHFQAYFPIIKPTLHIVINVSFPCVLWPPLWSSGQSSWLQIQRSGFDPRHYPIFWEVVGLERGPLSLVSTFEKLLGRKSSGSGLENREYGCMKPSRWPRSTLYPQTLALTLPTSGGRSVGIVRSHTQTTELCILNIFKTHGNAVGIATGYGLDDLLNWSEFESV